MGVGTEVAGHRGQAPPIFELTFHTCSAVHSTLLLLSSLHALAMRMSGHTVPLHFSTRRDDHFLVSTSASASAVRVQHLPLSPSLASATTFHHYFLYG